jgi:hypothetical protein
MSAIAGPVFILFPPQSCRPERSEGPHRRLQRA